MQTTKIVWILLGGLIAVITIILLACLMIDPKSEHQAQVIKSIIPITLDLLKIIVGAVVGVLGTTVGMKKAETGSKE